MMRMRAVLLSELGKNDAAVEELQESAQGGSQGLDDHGAIGSLYTTMKKYDKAAEAFKASWRIIRTTWRPCADGATPS